MLVDMDMTLPLPQTMWDHSQGQLHLEPAANACEWRVLYASLSAAFEDI